mmetsp:Transcript_54605/g.152384  ORF Transcript_54605/g.152384 Transcript_54605/m.152384 type:complete len:202 (-) Transcript_54605:595-1200(-)
MIAVVVSMLQQNSCFVGVLIVPPASKKGGVRNRQAYLEAAAALMSLTSSPQGKSRYFALPVMMTQLCRMTRMRWWWRCTRQSFAAMWVRMPPLLCQLRQLRQMIRALCSSPLSAPVVLKMLGQWRGCAHRRKRATTPCAESASSGWSQGKLKRRSLAYAQCAPQQTEILCLAGLCAMLSARRQQRKCLLLSSFILGKLMAG